MGELPGALMYPLPKIENYADLAHYFFSKGPELSKKKKIKKKKIKKKKNFLSVLEGLFQA